MADEPGGNGVNHCGTAQHADFDRADVQIGKNRVDLRGDEIRRHPVNGVTPLVFSR